MLANGKYEGVVDGQAAALRLCDVKIVTLGVRRWMTRKEGVWWIVAGVGDG